MLGILATAGASVAVLGRTDAASGGSEESDSEGLEEQPSSSDEYDELFPESPVEEIPADVPNPFSGPEGYRQYVDRVIFEDMPDYYGLGVGESSGPVESPSGGGDGGSFWSSAGALIGAIF